MFLAISRVFLDIMTFAKTHMSPELSKKCVGGVACPVSNREKLNKNFPLKINYFCKKEKS